MPNGAKRDHFARRLVVRQVLEPHSGQTWDACAVPAKTFPLQSLKFSTIFPFKPKVKTVAEKLSFILRI